MNATVLLVDDDVNLLHGLSRTLRLQPYRLLTARSAEEAMEVLKRQSVQLIVCDEYMGGMRGSEFMAWVSREFPGVVRIVLTGQPSVPAMLAAINQGCVYRYLTKPCRDLDLAMAIRDGLDQVGTETCSGAT